MVFENYFIDVMLALKHTNVRQLNKFIFIEVPHNRVSLEDILTDWSRLMINLSHNNAPGA